MSWVHKKAEPIDLPFGFVDSGGPKEAQLQSYLLGGANVHIFNRILREATYCLLNMPDDTLP